MAKAFVVAAPTSGSGKTLVTLGLIRSFRNRGLNVASCKVGPDYIDPAFHSAASGGPCYNLDPWAMGAENCRALFNQLTEQHDLIIIEGVMGLFDGPHGAAGSTADLAALLNVPVVLVVDTSHQAQSIAALVHGFSTFRQDVSIAGLILNRAASDRHLAMLTAALANSRVPIVGNLRRNDSLNWPSRHLGLVQAQENQELESFISSAAAGVARETNLDILLTIGAIRTNQSQAPSVFLKPLGQTISIAHDLAFSFLYPHILKGWRDMGATLQFFSPLANEPAPPSDAIYLPGGYPELHVEKLAGNAVFLTSLQNSTALIYGECGGYMVLGEALIDAAGVSHQMAGLLPMTTSFATPKRHLGYRQLKCASGPLKGSYRGHEFHYSSITNNSSAEILFSAKETQGLDLAPMGHRIGRVMGSYAHIISQTPA